MSQIYSRAPIVIISPRFPLIGGMSTYIYDLEKRLKKEGLKIIPITPYVLHEDSITIRDVIKIRFLRNLFIKACNIVVNIIKITMLPRKEALIAYIHTGDDFSFVENSFYTLFLKLFKIPTILHIHATNLHVDYKRSHFIVKKLADYVIHKYNIIIVISGTWKKKYEEILKIPHYKMKVIQNAVDTITFKPQSKVRCRDDLELSINKKIIFSLGVLTERKGFRYLIEAIDMIREQRDDVLCYIGGSGPVKEDLQNQINKLNLQDCMKLIGFIPSKSLVTWINACDIFVMPSLSESFGLVQVEAMACEKPVVATYNGGSEDIITNEDYGLLCERGNAMELATKILIALDKNWDGKVIRSYAERFSWDSSVEKIINVIDSLLC